MKLRHLNTKILEQTLLLKNLITRSRTILADHIWVPMTDDLRELDLSEGDTIYFSGKVVRYRKGKQLEMADYHLNDIRDCVKVDKIRLF